jgi:hypothetical protein
VNKVFLVNTGTLYLLNVLREALETSQNGRASVLHRGHGGLELRRQSLPEVLRNVPGRQMGGIVAEGVAISRAESTWGFDLRVGGDGRRVKTLASGASTLMIFS